MKHYLKSLFLIFGIIFPLNLIAETNIDGIYYILSGDVATVTRCTSPVVGDHGYEGDMVIPETVTYLGSTYTVTSIGDFAFMGKPITSIVFPNTIYRIGQSAFANCNQLTEVVLPNSVEGIGQGAFRDCENLKTIVIPSTITGISQVSFFNTTIEDIYCYQVMPSNIYLEYDRIFNDYSANLHVPATSLAAYFTAPVWCNFENIVGDAIEPTSISISKDSIGIYLDHQFQLNATIIPANTTTPDIVWLSTNSFIATVEDGLVSAVGLGECDIIAYSLYGYKAICHVSVTEETAIINLDQHEAMVLPNHMLTIIPTITPTSADLIVTSSDPTVAAARFVNGKVQVVGIKEGSATITVTTPNGNAQPDSCLVTVYTEMGDLNCDGFINISDVTSMIDYLLSGNSSNIKIENADVNKDNGVNIRDVTTLIDYLLSGTWPARTITVNGVSFKMVHVEGGTFMMGATAEQTNPREEEKPAHQVTLSSFSIGQTEVTQELWIAVMGSNPSFFTPAHGYDEDLNRPVESVSWYACQEFITRLNELTGMTFRLPTEAEWEYAARGGNKSKGYMYSGSNDINDVAWYGGNNTTGGSHHVGTKAPNELGIYDMSGNVVESCNDWYGSYSRVSQTNPTGPESGTYRIIRGGDWGDYPNASRVSMRNWFAPSYSTYHFGLRLAL